MPIKRGLAGLTVDPAECGTDQTGGLEDCFDDLASDAKPFNKFKNPYQPASTANPILVYMDNETSFIDAEDDCTSLNASLGVSSREGSSSNSANRLVRRSAYPAVNSI